jgi:hypothetical protein
MKMDDPRPPGTSPTGCLLTLFLHGQTGFFPGFDSAVEVKNRLKVMLLEER